MKIERREFLEIAGLVAAGAAAAGGLEIRAQRPLPKSEYDYVDWSWENWRNITKAVRPKISGGHSGKAELLELLESNGKKITNPSNLC